MGRGERRILAEMAQKSPARPIWSFAATMARTVSRAPPGRDRSFDHCSFVSRYCERHLHRASLMVLCCRALWLPPFVAVQSCEARVLPRAPQNGLPFTIEALKGALELIAGELSPEGL
jgi:hypothetical protein